MSQSAGGAAGGEPQDFSALFAQAVAASKQRRTEEPQGLYGRAAVAAKEAGEAEIAERCCTEQANCLITLDRYEQALAPSERAIMLDKVDSCQKALDRIPPADDAARIRRGREGAKQQISQQAGGEPQQGGAAAGEGWESLKELARVEDWQEEALELGGQAGVS